MTPRVRRGLWITVLAVVAFAVIVIARLPASWVVPSPPANVACASVDGSIWNGACTGLTVGGAVVGDVVWDVHATRLLAGKLAAHVVLTRTTGSAQGDVEVGLDKSITARNVRADLPLDRALMPQLPPRLNGNAHADIALARFENGIVTQLQGLIEAHNLEDRSGNITPLGNYSLTFPGGSGEPTGQLKDQGGPLQVEGTLRLTREPGFDLQGLVKPRADATADLTSEIQYLGSPDAQGRRPFALAATF
ncbi:MAG: ral secretion pathway protein [Gammaproteobacteria bacterium]|nr:ral secretion pathway protein [Gammaproteobacteria bacterium]